MIALTLYRLKIVRRHQAFERISHTVPPKVAAETFVHVPGQRAQFSFGISITIIIVISVRQQLLVEQRQAERHPAERGRVKRRQVERSRVERLQAKQRQAERRWSFV